MTLPEGWERVRGGFRHVGVGWWVLGDRLSCRLELQMGEDWATIDAGMLCELLAGVDEGGTPSLDTVMTCLQRIARAAGYDSVIELTVPRRRKKKKAARGGKTS